MSVLNPGFPTSPRSSASFGAETTDGAPPLYVFGASALVPFAAYYIGSGGAREHVEDALAARRERNRGLSADLLARAKAFRQRETDEAGQEAYYAERLKRDSLRAPQKARLEKWKESLR